jgi:uncharacterized membrane protein (UPF0127 family)
MTMAARQLSLLHSRRTLLAGIAAVALAAPALAADLQTFDKSKLVIETEKGKFPFNIELALTMPQMMQGLMFRTELAADAGMLFDYKQPETITMWMKNTYIPLDMVFIGADGKIVDFHERAVPQSLATIESKVPARAVLEVNSGTVARLGIKVGDVVHHAYFNNALN